MHFEVDQSGRIEETNRITVIGIANDKHNFTVVLSARLKRHLLEHFRRLGKPKIFPIIIFGVAVGVAIQKSKLKISNLNIDLEYPGHEQLVEEMVKLAVKEEINCNHVQIGKKSMAHYSAYGVFIGKRKADKTLRLIDLIKFLQ